MYVINIEKRRFFCYNSIMVYYVYKLVCEKW